MVEIVLCIAVVGFAMVAILGVLPTGFDVQRRNRENTIIGQEGSLWLEAVRSGAQGMDYLTGHVDVVSVPAVPGSPARAVSGTNSFRTGREIVGLLTQPAVIRTDNQGREVLYRRPVTAFVRAVSGTAGEKTPRSDFAFTYRLTVELVPYQPLSGLVTNWTVPDTNLLAVAFRSNQWLRAQSIRANTLDARLTLEWPVYFMNGRIQVGDNRKVLRALYNGTLETTNAPAPLGELNWVRSSEQLQLLSQ